MSWRLSPAVPTQVSLFRCRVFRSFRLHPPLTLHRCRLSCASVALPRDRDCSHHPSREVVGVFWTSPFASRLVKITGRIEFTCVADGSFPSGCSPPRLAATQFPLGTRSQASSRRGLSPRQLLHHHRRTCTTLRVVKTGGWYWQRGFRLSDVFHDAERRATVAPRKCGLAL